MNCRCHKWTHIEEEKPQDAFVGHDEKPYQARDAGEGRAAVRR